MYQCQMLWVHRYEVKGLISVWFKRINKSLLDKGECGSEQGILGSYGNAKRCENLGNHAYVCVVKPKGILGCQGS